MIQIVTGQPTGVNVQGLHRPDGRLSLNPHGLGALPPFGEPPTKVDPR
jgi:hypothetical protein